MIVTNATVFQGNPYHDLIYSGLASQYDYQRGTIETALDLLRAGKSDILHIHWEENPLRKCKSGIEAGLLLQRTRDILKKYVKEGGKVFWTVHNQLPHEMEYVQHLIEMRQLVADVATRILVHNVRAIEILNEQVDVSPVKFYLLPHPSYLGVYEPESFNADGYGRPAKEQALFFGLLRRYKGLDLFMEAIETGKPVSPKFQAKIRGGVIKEDPYAKVVESYAGRDGVDLEIENVANEDVAGLFSGARCVVIPYERFLTSGVALLAITFGTPVVASDVPQMRELLPATNHDFLFKPGDAQGLRDALARIMSLSKNDFRAVSKENRKRAEYYKPQRISSRLGELFDAASHLTSVHGEDNASEMSNA